MKMQLLKNSVILHGSVVVTLSAFAASANADLILTPGSTVTLTGSPYDTAGGVTPIATLVASTSGQPVNLIPGGLAGVTVNEAVYQEAGGTLDFLFQVFNGSTQPLGSVSLVNYTDPTNAPYQEFVGYATALPSPAGPFTSLGTLGEPVSVSRTMTQGAQDTDSLTPTLAAGATTEIFWMRTNATSYDNIGSITANGNTSNVGVIYEPTGVAVPEPATLSIGAALAALATLRRRSRNTI